MPSLGVALPRISPARGRVGEEAGRGQILQVPFRCAFGPPGPEDPPRVLLVGVELGVNEVLEIVLVVGTQGRDRACGFAGTGADVTGAGIGEAAVIAGSFSEAVEPLGAVGLRTGPFADDGPLVGSGELRAEKAGGGDVVRGAHGDLSWREDLILMSVENHILVARRGWGHEAVPIGVDVLESVMDAGCVVAAGSGHGLVAGLVEGLKLVEVERATKRLIEELNCRDDVSVAGIVLSEILKRGDGLVNRISLLPIHRPVAATVVEAILRSRRSMKIKQDFEISSSSPANGLIQDIQLALDVRVAL